MAVQKNKKTRSKRDKRRTHDRIANPTISIDELTGDVHRRHHISSDGYFRGELLVEKLAQSATEEDES